MQKLYNINFFRILFTLSIVYGHIIQNFFDPIYGNYSFAQNLKISFTYVYISDLFFIISGFFMFFSFLKNPTFKDFVVSKIVRLLPVLIVFYIVTMCISPFIDNLKYLKYENFLGACFLNISLITGVTTNNVVAWYINVLFWGFILYFCLIKIIPNEKKNYIIGLIVFFSYSILFNKMQLYHEPYVWNDGLLTYCMIRGIAGMGLGYLIASNFEFSKKDLKDSLTMQLIYTALEILTLSYLIKFTLITDLTFNFPLMVILFIIIFYLFLVKKGFISKLFDNTICYTLGKYCFSIYMMQEIFFNILKKTLWAPETIIHNNQALIIFISILIICVGGIITYYLVEKPTMDLYKNFKQKNRKQLNS